MFPCERCGICCRSIKNIFFAKDMVLPNGVCKFLDEKTNLCRIYSTRPIFCNVDAYYDTCLSHIMTREEFYRQTKLDCQKLRSSKDFPGSSCLSKKIFSFEELPDNLQKKLKGSGNVGR